MYTETITYNLRNISDTSYHYYQTVREFSINVLNYIEDNANEILSRYEEFITLEEIELLRSRGEYAVELLTLGLFWKRYLGASQRSPQVLLELLYKLVPLRNKYSFVKPFVDRIRGILNGIFLVPNIEKNPRDSHKNSVNFSRLLLWLNATDEFKSEVKRLDNWLLFSNSDNEKLLETIVQKAELIIDWFGISADKALGEYTENIHVFLKEKYPAYRFREDEIYAGKLPIEYHLNMVGSEIMNHGFYPNYKKCKKKIVLVPGCMRERSEQECKVQQVGLDIVCQHCTKTCRISHLSKIGEKHDFSVYIVPHSSSFTRWLKRWQGNKDTGLVAVACMLNLVPGGYEMRELLLNAQCVLLDYCGCKKHWHPDGIPTDLNFDQLFNVLDIKCNQPIMN